MRSKTKAISEGAMMLSMIALLMIVNRQLVGTFELLLFVLSIPVIIYTVKYGNKMGVILIVCSCFIAVLFATITSIFYLICALIIGLFYGYGINRGWKNQGLLLICILGNLVVTIITVFILSGLFGFDIQDDINLILNLLPDVIVMKVSLRQFVLIIVIISYMGMALMQAMLTHILAIEMLRRLKIKEIPIKNAFEFNFPSWMAILIVSSYIMYSTLSFITFNNIISNVILIFYSCMLMVSIVDGCITIICYLKLKRKGSLTIMFTLIACFIPVIQSLISVVGIVDIWKQLRNKMKEGVLNEIYRKN